MTSMQHQQSILSTIRSRAFFGTVTAGLLLFAGGSVEAADKTFSKEDVAVAQLLAEKAKTLRYGSSAMAIATKALERDVRNPLAARVIARYRRSDVFVRIAVKYENEGKFGKALAAYQSATKYVQGVRDYRMLGDFYYRRRIIDLAAAEYNVAIGLSRGKGTEAAKAYFGRGQTFEARKNYRRAATDYKTALRIDSRLVAAIRANYRVSQLANETGQSQNQLLNKLNETIRRLDRK